MPLLLYLRESTVGNLLESEEATEEFQVRLEKDYTKLIGQKVQLLNTSPEESK
jgi:uncharacterized circularly permuted ATP-grasp superfamily protein